MTVPQEMESKRQQQEAGRSVAECHPSCRRHSACQFQKSRFGKMLKELIDAFTEFGLEIRADKTHRTSCPEVAGMELHAVTEKIAWTPHNTLVVAILGLYDDSGPGIGHRRAEADKVDHRWKPLLLNRWVHVRKRVDLCTSAVFASLSWLCEHGTLLRRNGNNQTVGEQRKAAESSIYASVLLRA